MKPARQSPPAHGLIVAGLCVVAVGVLALVLYAGRYEQHSEYLRVKVSSLEELRDRQRQELRDARGAKPPPERPAPEEPPSPGLSD